MASVGIGALLLHRCSIIALNQTGVVALPTARVLICILVGVILAEVSIMARTDEVVGIDGTTAEVRGLVRLLTFAPVLALPYGIVGTATAARHEAGGHSRASEWVRTKRLVHIPVLIPTQEDENITIEFAFACSKGDHRRQQ